MFEILWFVLVSTLAALGIAVVSAAFIIACLAVGRMIRQKRFPVWLNRLGGD